MFLFFSGMDCKSSNNANKKLIQGKYNFCYFFWHFLKFICEYNTWSDAIDDNLAWKVNDCITSISYFTVHS